MKKSTDLTNKTFGKWTVLENNKDKPNEWICVCSCGTTKSVPARSLINGKSTKCRKAGCKFGSLINKRFGRLTVISHGKPTEKSRYTWECLCDCGNKIVVDGYRLVSGTTKSCSCYWRDIVTSRQFEYGEISMIKDMVKQ